MPELRTAVAEDLRGSAVTRAATLDHVASLRGSDYDDLLCRSLDTATHLKLSLATTAHRGFRAWLHIYKPWSEGEHRYAASIHNHRYAFVSKILSGGYTEQTWSFQQGYPTSSGLREYRTGDVVETDHEDIHSLKDVMPGTITFIAQLPTQRAYSVVYPHDSRAPTRIFDLEHKVEQLLSAYR